MKTDLIGAVAAVALLAAGSVAMAQGAGNREGGGAAGAAQTGGHEAGAAGGAGKMGGQRGAEGGGNMGAGAGGERMGGQKGAEGGKMGAEGGRMGAGEKMDNGPGRGKMGEGREGQRADHGDRDRADRDRGDRDRAGLDRGDRGDRDRADRGDRENINVRIRVGAPIPAGRRLEPLRGELVTRYPQYRGYQMFVENDEVVIVDPGTRKIVRTVSEGTAGMNHRPTNCD